MLSDYLLIKTLLQMTLTKCRMHDISMHMYWLYMMITAIPYVIRKGIGAARQMYTIEAL